MKETPLSGAIPTVIDTNRLLQVSWQSHSQTALDGLGDTPSDALDVWLAEEEEEIGQLPLHDIFLEWLPWVECHVWAWPTSMGWWGRRVLQSWEERLWEPDVGRLKCRVLKPCAALSPELQGWSPDTRVPLGPKKHVARASLRAGQCGPLPRVL